jgi:putative hydrolase
VAEILIDATVRGLERASRYAPTQLARPLSLLAQVGLDDAVVTPDMLDALATACRQTGTLVEVSEAWRSPSGCPLAMLRSAGVSLVAASDARYAAEVGRWQYLRRI